MLHELRATLGLLIIFTVLTGVAYPLLVTGIGRTALSYQASGSLVEQNGLIIGSKLIGQPFTQDKYFHPRPSAAGNGYDASDSSGSNLAPSATDFLKTVTERALELRKSSTMQQIPVDLVTASGSGLDPDISVAGALFQAERVAASRGLSLHQVQELITSATEPRTFGFLGENRVNVLTINQSLDQLAPAQ
jgi:K+-transporting ATPase ATPase C chain